MMDLTACHGHAAVEMLVLLGLSLAVCTGSDAANLDLCSDVERVESDGQLSTDGYPSWYSAPQCHCDVTSHDVTGALDITVEFKAKDKPTGCDPRLVVSSTNIASFQICPLTPGDFSQNVTNTTMSLKTGHVTRITLDNPKEAYLVVRIQYETWPDHAVTVNCSGRAGLGVLAGTISSDDNWWDREAAMLESEEIGSGMADSIIAVIVIVIVLVILVVTAFVKSVLKKREFRQKRAEKQNEKQQQESSSGEGGQHDNPAYDHSVHMTLEDDLPHDTTPSGTQLPSNGGIAQPVVFMNMGYVNSPNNVGPVGQDLDLSLQSVHSTPSLGGTPDIRGHIPTGVSSYPDPHRSRQSLDCTPSSSRPGSRPGSRQTSTLDLAANPPSAQKPSVSRYSPGGSNFPRTETSTRPPPGERAGPRYVGARPGTSGNSPVPSVSARTPNIPLTNIRVPPVGLYAQPHVVSPRPIMGSLGLHSADRSFATDTEEDYRTPQQSPGSTARGIPYHLNSSMSPALATNGMSLPLSSYPGETAL